MLAIGLLLTISAHLIWRGEADNEWGPPSAARMVFAVVLGLASLPAWTFGLLLALLGWATIGCPPDGYECPV